MKAKRAGGRVFKVQEVEVVRRPSPPVSETPVERALDGLRQLRRHVSFNWRQTEHRLDIFWSKCQRGFENRVGKKVLRFAQPPMAQPVFAAMSRKWTNSTETLTHHQSEIKKRIAHVPVYLVAKQNGKLVYIKPESERTQRPVGLLFLTATGARQLLHKVRQDVPEFAKDMEIISLDMGSLYEMFSNKKLNHLKDVIFRFVPEIQQINHAMEVMRRNGRRQRVFSGVPLFHVDGLVTGQNRLRPLFFNKEDLELAVDSATSRKLEKDRNTLRDEIDVLKGEAQEARLLAKQSEGADAEKWMSIAAKAETKSRKVTKQLQELPDSLSSMVDVEVRSLEDVLSEMERDKSGQYGNTMLIPSGLASGQMLESPFTNVGEKKIVNFQENRTSTL